MPTALGSGSSARSSRPKNGSAQRRPSTVNTCGWSLDRRHGADLVSVRAELTQRDGAPLMGGKEPCDDPAVGAMDVAVDSEIDRLRGELERLRAENVRLSRLLDLRGQDTAPAPEQLSAAVTPPGLVVMSSSVEDKLALYIDRFRARADAYAVRRDNARTGVSGWMPAVAGGWRKGMDRKGATYLPLTAEAVSAHLVGDVFIGLYPLLTDNSCHFLVA